MKMTNIELINRAVEESKVFPDPVIEYNFDELPKAKGINKISFYGVKAVFNPRKKHNTANVIYKY